ncbi:hypothetical protein GX441_10445 [bacterium]|nr:hypothetical protein [bacterium]
MKEEKRTFERWVKDKKINHPVYLRIIAGFSESSLLTEKEFDSAVDKYLFNKE